MTHDAPDELTLFLAELECREASTQTIRASRQDLTAFGRFLQQSTGEVFTAAAVTPTDLREYRPFLLHLRHAAPATINRHLAALRKLFLWAKAQGWLRELPTEAVRGVGEVARSPKWLEKRDVDRLLREAEKGKSKRDLATVRLLRHTGLRVGELVALQIGDVETSERKGAVVVRSGKGGKQRSVPLNVDARKAVEAYKEVRPRVPSDHLFISQRGAGLQAQAVENLVKKYARRAALEDVTPHTLRHTFGKSLVDAGIDLGTVATLLGHERLETTALYTQPGAGDLEQAVARLEQDADPATLAAPRGRARSV
jgi:site-specific recombinase XerD